MRNRSFLFLAMLVFPAIAISQEKVSPRKPTPPGLIATFLSATQNARITTELLGVLGGPAGPKATFTAVVAEDPIHPGVKVKGIEIEMEQAARKLKVYLDDDRSVDSRDESLSEFVFALNWLAQNQATRLSEARKRIGGTESSLVGATVGALNRAASNAEYCCPRYTVFNAGWYGRGEELGVVMDDAGKTRDGFTLFLPNVRLTRVVDLVAAGKAWLDLN